MEGAGALGVTRSLSGRRWVWREAEERVGLGIAERLGVPEILGRLLAVRGVTMETAGDFLDPTLRVLLPDPSRLTDMDRAVERLAAAVVQGEKVAVFGDYDVDGACAGALLVSVLAALGAAVATYVPDRIREGYGPNPAALRRLAEEGAGLIVCADCGSGADAAFAAIAGRADVIVLDHHKTEALPGAHRAPLVALVNPSRMDDRSGLGAVSATAIAFLAMVALLRLLRRQGFFAGRAEPDLLFSLDLVAFATVCDVMPLSGLNRALVTQGLKVMARRRRPGLAALLAVAEIAGNPTAESCGFALGPRINAAGRIAEADLGLRLLLAADTEAAMPLARTLDAVNRQRQQVEMAVLEAAMAAAAAQAEAGVPVLLVSGPDWHPGVLGIVAGRIKERFNRPACVLGVSGAGSAADLAKGSGRSVPGLDLGAAVLAARQAGLLAAGGGHAMAAGFSLAASGLAAFHAFLNERLAQASLLPSAADLMVEGALAVPGATAALAAALGRLAPFGAGNAEPVLALPRVSVVRAERVGASGRTIRAILAGEDGGRLKAVAFRSTDGALAPALLERAGRPLHLAGYLRLDRWNGTEAPGFVIADAALA